MKKKIVGILVVTLLITGTVLPVIATITNISIFKGSEDKPLDDLFNACVEIKHTSDGGYILAGLTEKYGAGSRDYWLIKTDSNGVETWNQTFGRSGCDIAYSVDEVSTGGYILAGHGRFPSNWDTDFWVIKTNSQGGQLWDKRFGKSPDEDVAFMVRETSDGGFIVVGTTESYGAGLYDVWLIKLDSDGNEDWNETYGGGSNDGAHSVIETNDGGYAVTGLTQSYGSGGFDVWLIKTNSSGKKEWDECYGGAEDDQGNNLIQTSDDGYVIIGSTSSFGDEYEFYLIKTDLNGNEEWTKTWSGANTQTGISSLIKFKSGMSVQETTGGYIITGITDEYGAEQNDALLIKTDTSGNDLWKKTFGGSVVDEAFYVDVVPGDYYMIGGLTKSFGTSNRDCWMIKTASDGTEQWNKTIPVNSPPFGPSDPEPEDEEIDVNIDTKLSWTGGDPDNDPVKYDVYFGKSSPPPKVKSNQSSTSYNPGLLDFETEYFWKIVAWDSPGGLSTFGPIWSFTTEENLPPYEPSDPDPSDGATDVSIYKTLSWKGGDPNEVDEVTYDVYFGTNSPPPLVAEDIEQESYDQGTMELFTTYYWQIVSEDPQGLITEGPIWSFTTEEEPNEPPTAPEIDGPTEGPANTELCWTFHSDDPNENQVKYFIDWGDENTDETALSEPCTPIEKCHSYEAKGEYTITAYAQDEKGLNGDENTFKVTIPRTRTAYYSLIKQLFERFPSLLPLFKKLLFK